MKMTELQIRFQVMLNIDIIGLPVKYIVIISEDMRR